MYLCFDSCKLNNSTFAATLKSILDCESGGKGLIITIIKTANQDGKKGKKKKFS